MLMNLKPLPPECIGIVERMGSNPALTAAVNRLFIKFPPEAEAHLRRALSVAAPPPIKGKHYGH